MKIICPSCKRVVEPEQVNMGTDMAFCVQCNEGFKISESVDQDFVNAGALQNPPSGAWFRRGTNEIVLGASTRSPAALFIVPFMLVWSGGSLGGIYGTQIASGEFDLAGSLFGIPFLLGSVVLWTVALMAVFGKVEVTIASVSSVFVGIGPLGWRRDFDWAAVKSIREENSPVRGRRGFTNGKSAIVMDGKQRLSFATGLNEKRRYFILNALKLVKAESASRFR